MTHPDDLKSIGLKATYPRLKILDLFHKLQDEGAPRHVTAEDVYRHLLADGLDIGLATVYRVLTQFEQAGLLQRHHFESGKSIFELNAGNHHDHLVCVDCGRVEEFFDAAIEKRQTSIARERGFTVREHALYLYAECNKTDCPHRKAGRLAAAWKLSSPRPPWSPSPRSATRRSCCPSSSPPACASHGPSSPEYFVATVLNHALAGSVGVWLAQLIAPHWLPWITGGVFVVFGLWALHPDSLDEDPKIHPAGAFVTTTIAFFIAEMGDKTQFATVALGAQFQGALFAVVMGTTLGMMLANVPAVLIGEKLAARLPLKYIRWLAAAVFIATGVVTMLAHAGIPG
jgi:Fe2+ or Zn2+ uptake regulation protein/putative Ca2+/H+ antiporter (TMEM165/GDT1 family)